MMSLVAGLAAYAAADLGPEGLDAFRWRARPVVVIAEPGDPRLAQQLALFEADAADMAERRNVVIVDGSGGARLRERIGGEGFTVALIGLDGGVKLRRGAVVDPATLERLIDRMPMRRQEMGRD